MSEEEDVSESGLSCLQVDTNEQSLDISPGCTGMTTTLTLPSPTALTLSPGATLNVPSSLRNSINEDTLCSGGIIIQSVESQKDASVQSCSPTDIFNGKLDSAISGNMRNSAVNIPQNLICVHSGSDIDHRTRVISSDIDHSASVISSSIATVSESITVQPTAMCSILSVTGSVKAPRKSTPRKIIPKPKHSVSVSTIENVSPLQQSSLQHSPLHHSPNSAVAGDLANRTSIALGHELEKTVYVVSVDSMEILGSLQETSLTGELPANKTVGSPPHPTLLIENHFNDAELLGSVAAETEVTTTFQGLGDYQRMTVSQGLTSAGVGGGGGLSALDAINIIDVHHVDGQLWRTEDVVKMPGGEDSSDTDLNVSQEAFVALVPLGDDGLPPTPREQELALRSFNKRMRDREKKRLLRKDPDYRSREKEAAKQRMKMRRLDPMYREHERQRDRARRRVVRETNPNQRAKERERDKIYKRRHRVLSVDYVMSEVEVSDNVNESLSAFCNDIVDFPPTTESNS